MVAAFLLLVVVGLNTLRTEGGSSTGPAAGDELPPFAAPLVLSDVEGDVNLARDARTRAQPASARRARCSDPARSHLLRPVARAARGARLLRRRRAALRAAQLDELERRAALAAAGCAAAAVAVRGDRGDLRATVRSRGWRFPVVQDRDGALANVYGVAVCPQLTFVLPGGRVQRELGRELSAASSDAPRPPRALPRSGDRATRAGPEWAARAMRGADAAGRSARRGLGRADADRGVSRAGRRSSATSAAPPPRADPGVAERLGYLASRFNGRRAVELRREPVPAAYRVFFRHLGLDPDVTRTPIEEAALARLIEGGHRSQNRLADALLLALLETGVPVSAFDSAAVDGAVGLREALRGERLGDGELAPQLAPGTLVLADAAAPARRAVRRPRRRRRCRAADRAPDAGHACRIPQVPAIHVEEALWICCEALAPSA